jgi:hypothetical protein
VDVLVAKFIDEDPAVVASYFEASALAKIKVQPVKIFPVQTATLQVDIHTWRRGQVVKLFWQTDTDVFASPTEAAFGKWVAVSVVSRPLRP